MFGMYFLNLRGLVDRIKSTTEFYLPLAASSWMSVK
jgi:hypothetical protein